jgi:hypothetical protein
MYIIREVFHCKPGKVRDMVNRFKALSTRLQAMGARPLHIYTDVSGKPYWTVVAETEADSLDGFFVMEQKTMSDPEAQKIMAGYHDSVDAGHREIYQKEA